jgi:hypothetical protein
MLGSLAFDSSLFASDTTSSALSGIEVHGSSEVSRLDNG